MFCLFVVQTASGGPGLLQVGFIDTASFSSGTCNGHDETMFLSYQLSVDFRANSAVVLFPVVFALFAHKNNQRRATARTNFEASFCLVLSAMGKVQTPNDTCMERPRRYITGDHTK